MIPFKTSSRSAPFRVASLARSVRGEWRRWLNTGSSGLDDSVSPEDAGASTSWPAEPLDIDLSALESVPSIHWVQAGLPPASLSLEAPPERRRSDAPDPWRTRPDIRFQPPDALGDPTPPAAGREPKGSFRQ